MKKKITYGIGDPQSYWSRSIASNGKREQKKRRASSEKLLIGMNEWTSSNLNRWPHGAFGSYDLWRPHN
jgi:hypothetical protein